MRWRIVPALLAACLITAAAGTEPEAEDINTFPDAPGREETFGLCSACHGFRLVAAQGMTREQWASSLIWMTERHGMPVLEQADRDVILDYLTKAFPPKAPTGWRNPFLPR